VVRARRASMCPLLCAAHPLIPRSIHHTTHNAHTHAHRRGRGRGGYGGACGLLSLDLISRLGDQTTDTLTDSWLQLNQPKSNPQEAAVAAEAGAVVAGAAAVGVAGAIAVSERGLKNDRLTD
jgi:hypothetical protein